ncbi:hypothetical protein F66182_6838 [Fusarium sp. NRRL 66182]|nr:hypothetical protein F66182_6838 [Fusarium sp. NRRL 66182]
MVSGEEIRAMARLQLHDLQEWEDAYGAWTTSNVPKAVAELRALRAHLEAVATGAIRQLASEELLRFHATYYSSNQLSHVDASTPTALATAAAAAAISRDDAAHEPAATVQASVITEDTIIDSSVAAAAAAAVVPHGAPTHPLVIFNSNFEGKLEEDLYSDDKVQVSLDPATKGEVQEDTAMNDKDKLFSKANTKSGLKSAIEARKPMLSRAINALSFLPAAEVGHIRSSEARKDTESPVRDKTSNEQEDGFQQTSECLSPAIETPIAINRSIALVDNAVEEDLISFDMLPSEAETLAENQSSYHHVHSDDSFTEHHEDTKSDDSDVASLGETQYIIRGIDGRAYRRIKGHCVHEEAYCIKCGETDIRLLYKCRCVHYHCAKCLRDLVDAAVRDQVAFAPSCCELPLPVDANSGIFSRQQMNEFLAKKYGGGFATPIFASLANSNGYIAPTPPIEEDGQKKPSNHAGVSKMCPTCKRTLEMDAYCPDCCHRCSKSRRLCRCSWWAERQEKQQNPARAYKKFDPKASSFVPPHFRGRQHMFPTANPEPRCLDCKHPEFKIERRAGRCFDCQDFMGAYLWYCVECEFHVCDSCVDLHRRRIG